MTRQTTTMPIVFVLLIGVAVESSAHEDSLPHFLAARQAAQKQAADRQADAPKEENSCQLTVALRDAKSGDPLAGLVRVSTADGKFVPLAGAIERANHWYSIDAGEAITVPRGKIKLEALHGIEWEAAERRIDLTGKGRAMVRLDLTRFYDRRDKVLFAGNTHVHLRSITRAEADRYLDVVSRGDQLDMVYVSHLRRIPDERTYISNTYTPGDMLRLSKRGVLFGWGQEHRHNFTGYGEGYGHVMLLDIAGLIRPVSIGPGIMQDGTDGRPMRAGILEARRQKATVIWCHNKFGMEDIPNWLAGVLDAQNIFDGGTHGSYEDTYYRYLNLGLKVPFSTGTDWFIYDFARVYVPIKAPLSSRSWLEQLRAGRSFITNGPLLQLTAGDGARIGDTVKLDGPGKLRVRAHAEGRVDFGSLELIYNGVVAHRVKSQPEAGHFTAEFDFPLPVEGTGWIALRTPLGEAKSELDKELFSHTSAIYVDVAGRPIFRADTARELLAEMKQSIGVINDKGKFADDAERESVLEVYRKGIAVLQQRIDDDESKHNNESEASATAGGGKRPRLTYPKTHKSDVVDDYHGTKIADPYRWLEDPDSDETQAWVEAQNEVTFAYLEQLPQRKPIQRRLTRLWNYERFGLPHERGGKYFYSHNDGLQNQSEILVADSLDAKPRLLLDPNKLSKDGTVTVSSWSLSDDGKYLAYALASAGSDWNEWKVRDVASGKDLDDHLKWSKFSGASWTPDGRGFYYSRYDEPAEGATYTGANYFMKLYYHRLGEPQSSDTLVYERKDHKEWGFGGEVTEDGKYLIITNWRGTEQVNQIFYQDLGKKDAAVEELITGFDADYTFLGNNGSKLFLLTDLDAPLKRIIEVDVERPDRANWREVIPEAEEVLRGASIVGDVLFAQYLKDAHSVVKRFDLAGKPLGEVKLPGLGSAGGFGGRRDQQETFYYYTSFTRPATIYRYDLKSGETTVFRQPKVDFRPDDYVVKQVFAKSKDGTRVPMYIVHRKDVKPDGNTPTMLYGYGGFNIPLVPEFSVFNLVWLEAGGVYARANLRGGGEYGREWHEAGTKERKQNVFDDFIASAEWLCENGYTRPQKLGIIGRSNGGLLVGAAMTQRPDLFKVAQPGVGVLDMLRYHKFTIGWAWVSDYGSSDNAEEFKSLAAYSPLHNLQPGVRYPSTLITTGDHDDRVVPAHSHKFAATLQAAHKGENPVLIRIDTSAGHGAGKPTEKIIEESADVLAFFMDELGLKMSK